ncbi:MAG: hypothetical protein WAS50_17135 [Nitrospira sp.]
MGLRGHNALRESRGQVIRFLVSLIGSTHVAFPSHWVRGIVTPGEASGGGAVTWGHAVYDRTDLADRFSIRTTGLTAETRLVLYANEGCARCFAVEKVLGLIDVERDLIQPLPAQFRGKERERLLGFFVEASYVALIVNPFWVLELPSRNNILEVFALQVSNGRPGEFDSRLKLASAVLEDLHPVSTGSST